MRGSRPTGNPASIYRSSLLSRAALAPRRASRRSSAPAPPNPELARRASVQQATFTALRRYLPGHFAGRLIHFFPSREWVNSPDQPLRWRSCARYAAEYYGPTGCELDVMLLEPYARVFAELFAKARGTPASSRPTCRNASSVWGSGSSARASNRSSGSSADRLVAAFRHADVLPRRDRVRKFMDTPCAAARAVTRCLAPWTRGTGHERRVGNQRDVGGDVGAVRREQTRRRERIWASALHTPPRRESSRGLSR